MGRFGSFRGESRFDCLLLISQIVGLQSFLYFTLCLFLFIGLSDNLSLSAIFDFRQINVSNSVGILIMISFVINSLLGSLYLWIFVKRRKMCLDFCSTYHLIHFFICLFFEGEFPSLSYWLLNITCLVIMTVTSEYLCLKEEMKEIPLYQSLSTKADL